MVGILVGWVPLLMGIVVEIGEVWVVSFPGGCGNVAGLSVISARESHKAC